MIVLVVGLFYVVGWQIGAVEAISLSILVGSSVDYCVHLVEGYLLAGKNPPFHVTLVRYLQWTTSTGHVIGQTCHYDVIDYVFRCQAARSLGNKHKINDVIMTNLSYHVKNPFLM